MIFRNQQQLNVFASNGASNGQKLAMNSQAHETVQTLRENIRFCGIWQNAEANHETLGISSNRSLRWRGPRGLLSLSVLFSCVCCSCSSSTQRLFEHWERFFLSPSKVEARSPCGTGLRTLATSTASQIHCICQTVCVPQVRQHFSRLENETRGPTKEFWVEVYEMLQRRDTMLFLNVQIDRFMKSSNQMMFDWKCGSSEFYLWGVKFSFGFAFTKGWILCSMWTFCPEGIFCKLFDWDFFFFFQGNVF